MKDKVVDEDLMFKQIWSNIGITQWLEQDLSTMVFLQEEMNRTGRDLIA